MELAEPNRVEEFFCRWSASVGEVDSACRIDQVYRSHDHQLEGHFKERAEEFGDSAIGVGQDWELESVFLGECLVGLGAGRVDPKNVDLRFLESIEMGLEVLKLGCAAWCVVSGVEAEKTPPGLLGGS